MTALDDSAHGNVDELHFESHKFQVQYSEADVGFCILSAGKTSQQSNWLEGYQVMLPGTGGQTTRTCAKDSNVAKLEENVECTGCQGRQRKARMENRCASSEWQG